MNAPAFCSDLSTIVYDFRIPSMAMMHSPTPAMAAPHQPIIVRVVTIAPAISTPAAMARKARQKGNPSRKARIAPVQAPVKGRGIATKIVSPRVSYLSTIFPLLLDRSNTQLIILSNSFTLLKSLTMGSRNSNRKGTGNRLPARATTKAMGQEIWNVFMANGIAPRSSDIGAAAVKKTLRNSDTVIMCFSKDWLEAV